MKPDNDLQLDPPQRRMILERCADFGGLVDEVLIRHLELKRYDREETLYGFGDPNLGRPLRVIVLGHVAVVQRRGQEQTTLACGPMTTFGEEGVKAWNDQSLPGATAPEETTSAITRSLTWVLELPVKKFAAVFGEPGGDRPLLRRILGAYKVSEIGSQIIEVLRSRPELADVDPEGLQLLLEGAEIQAVKAGQILAAQGETPNAFFVMLRQESAFISRRTGPGSGAAAGKESVVEQRAPACAGLGDLIRNELLGDTLCTDTLSVEADARVIRIPVTTYRSLFKLNADFQRAILRGSEIEVPEATLVRGGAQVANLFLIIAGSGVSLPVRGLTDLLALTIATHLYDRVLVVHAVPRGAARATARQEIHREPSVHVEHLWIEVDGGLIEAFEAALARHTKERAPGQEPPDVTLLEASALPRGHAFEQELAGSALAFKVVHLANQPDALPPIAFIAAGVEIFYVAILDEAGATPPAEATSARAKLGAYARRIKATMSDARHLSANTLAPTWPRGAVRLRLAPPLLEALARRGGAPIQRLDELGAEIAKTARPTLERWARAVTSRRVGLALGGGGTYGDMHVPLIRSLIDAEVPIDMVSGSSVGSTIGAYFCALDLPGLTLYWKHRKRLLSAGGLGFLSSAAIELAMIADLGDRQLDETEIPLFPVVTDADSGLESDLRKGTFAFAVRASGSLPPLMGPTVQGDRRYLDGGLVANVPVNVLRTEGADLIIASNPIARLAPRKRRPPLRLPVLGPLLRESHPFARIQDAFRMVPMIFGSVGESQTRSAHVVYRPAATEASLAASHESDFLARAQGSPLLKKAVAEAVNGWRKRLRNAPSRVRIEGRQILVAGRIGFADSGQIVDPASGPELHELAAFLNERLEILRVDVQVSGARRGLAGRQAAALKAQLQSYGVAPQRLTASGSLGLDATEPAVTFAVIGLGEREVELRKLREAESKVKLLSAEALREKRRADARTLTMAAEERARLGGLDLAGLLAIEAARLDRSPQVDAVLRVVLARRGRMLRSIPARDAVCLAWHPVLPILAIGSDDGLRLWDAKAGDARRLAKVSHDGPDPAVSAAVFSASGRLASAGQDQRVLVHEVIRAADDSLELKRIFEARVGTREHWGLAFSPDGQRLVSAIDTPSDLAVWRLADGALVHRLAGGGSTCRFVAWEPRSERLAAAMSDGAVHLWSATTGELLETIATRKEGAVHVAWHPDGGLLAIAAAGTAKIHDLRGAPGDRAAPIELYGHRRQVTRVAWSHDGSRVATVGADLTTRVWRPSDGQLAMSLRGYHGQMLGAAFHPNRVDVIATWTETGAVTVWDADSGEPSALLLGHDGAIRAAGWHVGGELLATTSTDATAKLWDPKARGQVAWKRHEGARITALAYAPGDAARIVSADSIGAACLWDPRTNQEIAELFPPSVSAGSADAAWSPQRGDRLVVTRAHDAAPTLFHADGTRATPALAAPSRALAGATSAPHRARWSPDGHKIAVNQRRRVVIWDAETGAVAREIEIEIESESESAEEITAIAWHPDSSRLAIARSSSEGAVTLVDARASDAAHDRRIVTESGAWSVDFLADGSRIAIGCHDRLARVHDVASGDLIASYRHASAVRVVAFSPDQRWLATGDATQTATVWSLATGKRASGDDSHGNRIEQLAWASDSERLVSVSLDGIVCLWRKLVVGTSTRFISRGVLASPRCRYEIAALSPDARWIVIGDDEGEAQRHPVELDELINSVGRLLQRTTMSEQEWSRYMPDDAIRRPTWSEPQPG
ncbi:MAG: patatin-like phospholipase family protein [Byssovorax sp.]